MKTIFNLLLALLPLGVYAQSPVTEPVTTNTGFPTNAISLATTTTEKEEATTTEEIEPTTVVAENTALSSAITIFPNPAKSLCTIGVNNKEFSNFSYVIADEYDYVITSGQGTTTLNVSGLTPGKYIVKVTVGESVGYKELNVVAKQ